jgi:hypothetical protein
LLLLLLLYMEWIMKQRELLLLLLPLRLRGKQRPKHGIIIRHRPSRHVVIVALLTAPNGNVGIRVCRRRNHPSSGIRGSGRRGSD